MVNTSNGFVPKFHFALVEGFSDTLLLPSRATELDSGWDVKCAADTIISSLATKLIPLGIKVICPPGWWLELKPRSSTHFKKHLHCLNGVIDNGYEGHIQLCATFVTSSGADQLFIPAGEKIAQLIPRRLEEMSVDLVSEEEFLELSKSRENNRRANGFGSTGV